MTLSMSCIEFCTCLSNIITFFISVGQAYVCIPLWRVCVWVCGKERARARERFLTHTFVSLCAVFRAVCTVFSAWLSEYPEDFHSLTEPSRLLRLTPLLPDAMGSEVKSRLLKIAEEVSDKSLIPDSTLGKETIFFLFFSFFYIHTPIINI